MSNAWRNMQPLARAQGKDRLAKLHRANPAGRRKTGEPARDMLSSRRPLGGTLSWITLRSRA